ncbi:MAG: hypothetical protein GX748_00475, partial [Lentisphaerae bacterium]|nr:hypothetical protein [Lentisphaerota bacterium]
AETTVKQTSNARVFAIDHAGAIVKGFTIRNGRGGTGGGVYFGTNGGTLEDCTVEECLSTGNGGGVYLQAGAVLRRTVVRHCAHSTRSFGGGIYFNKGGYAENCLVYGCQSTWGCNAYSDGLNGAMVNCTIGHYPTPGAGNFYNYSSSFVATNCIFLGGVTSYSLSSSKCTLTDDPGWRDPSDGDYTLASTATAAIDAGDDDVLAYPASDIDGLARPKGAHVDIGCHEFDDTMFSCDISASATSIAVGGEVVFTPFVTAGSTPVITWRIVNLAGGAPIERVTEGSGETGACTVQFDAPGWYRVSLSVTDGTNHASAELNEHVTVSAAGDYFVSPSGSATPPFGSWATAATNLSAAVRLAGEGSAIHVAAGTWELMETITMDRALTLTGAGRDATFIRTPASSSFRALKLAHAAARARGFTLTATTGIGFVEVGVGAHVTAGRLENVRVCDCRATHNIDGIAVALNGNNAVLSHAIVNGNKNGSSGCINVRGGASIDNSLSYNNAAAYCGGLFVYGVGNGVTNCTINGNIGFQYNNGPAFSKLVNCVVNGSPSEWDATSVADGNAFVHCAFTAAQPGVGNVTDPLAFVDAVNGDFHLPPDSMCSGAGLFAPWMRRATDLDDKRRAYAGSVDIGCYQYPTPPAGSILLVK